jgi:hypothetical protein
MTGFASEPVGPELQLTAHHDRTADAGSESNEHDIGGSDPCSDAGLGQ